ncbi:MAG: hypothetical protein Q9160_006169 [Pyrenula sp. 1 TL-2023]
MCKDPLHDLLVALPKCEQHLHLEGTLEPPLLFKLASENGVSLPSSQDDPAFTSVETLLERYQGFTSLDDFLHYYFIGMTVLVKASDFEALAWNYLVRAKKDNVAHAEVFFDPQAHTERGIDYVTVFQGYQTACKRATAELGISTELIVCFLRHLPPSSAESTYNSALKDLRSGAIAGIGLSSTEKGNPPKLFQSVYTAAERLGIRRTAHAGEEADVSYMRGALEDLHIQRVDHGIRLPEDPMLMADFARQKILVTMCPVSNVKLRCVESVSDLPIKRYLDEGVQFSINSDDPAYFGAYIQANYCAVQEAFKLNIEDWQRIASASINGSWCFASRKQELQAELEAVMASFQ